MRNTASSSVDPTRTRIKQAAAELFASLGIDAVTTRSLAERAGANTAAVNYHFGGKDNLAIEVFRDVARTSSQRRIENLEMIVDAAKNEGQRPRLHDIIETFVDAYVNEDDSQTGVLLAHFVLKHRVAPNEWTHAVVRGEIDTMAKRYIEVLSIAAPHLSIAEVHWRYHLMVGAILLTLSDRTADNRIARLSDGLCSTEDVATLRHELIAFLTNAFAGELRPPKQKS